MRLPARLPDLRVRQDARASLDVAEGDPPECGRDRGQSEVVVRASTSGNQGLRLAAWAAARAEESVAVPRTRSRPRVVKRERRVTGGVFWIGIVATLLAGVVATNVAVLRLNMKLDSLGRERADLRAQNAQLSSQLSSAASAPRIQKLAAKQLGWVQATSDQTTYFNLNH
jgi:cell division protein FtsL